MNFQYLITHFFTHKDFLLPSDQLLGTMFTPLHFAFAAVALALTIGGAVFLSRKSEATIRKTFAALWLAMVVLEVVKILWESVSGSQVRFEVGGVLPLYPCSIFMYAMPFAIWGKGGVKKAACGYVCTLGLLGAAINFAYPATILSNYSCISFSGFHTFFYHGTMLLTCLTMLLSGYHRYNAAEKWWEMFLASLPGLIVSIPANIVNFSPIGSDYMFFKCNSFFLPALVGDMTDVQSTVMIYFAYLLVPALFYLPGYLRSRKGTRAAAKA